MSKQYAKSEQFKQLWVLMKSIINDPSYHEFLKIREESKERIEEKYLNDSKSNDSFWESIRQREKDYKHLFEISGMLETYRFYNLKLTPSYSEICDYARNMYFKADYH